MPISPACPRVDANLDAFYAEPKIVVVKDRNEFLPAKTTEIGSYTVFFQNKDLKNIYIQGNPGMGKSTYSKKLTLDWCKYISRKLGLNDTQVEDISGLELDFDFLFLISLRENNGTCQVKQMVIDSVIDKLSNLSEYKYEDKFLSTILDTERCLIILDGLDEWNHPVNSSCKALTEDIPHRSTGGHCVYLTLTRPWKLCQIYLKDSEIDLILDIDGVKRPNELISKVICCLNTRHNKSNDPKEFISILDEKVLLDLKAIPIVSMMLACIWHDTGKIPDSKSAVYSSLLYLLFKRENEKRFCTTSEKAKKKDFTGKMPYCFRINGMRWCEEDTNTLLQFGEFAYRTLFLANDTSSRITWSDSFVDDNLDFQTKQKGLKIGLLTEYDNSSLNLTCSKLSFLHKTVQEFLAAFYLSFQSLDEKDKIMARIKKVSESIDDISQLFIFLCGLESDLASSVSKILTAKTGQMVEKLFRGYDFWELGSFGVVESSQRILNKGFSEHSLNSHRDAKIEMRHICFGEGYIRLGQKPYTKEKEISPQEDILQNNLGCIETIVCNNDKYQQKANKILSSNTKSIKTLVLSFVDDPATLNNCICLQTLDIKENSKNLSLHLNLSKALNLENIFIRQESIDIDICSEKLQICELENYDLDKGNIVKTLETSLNLKTIHFSRCKVNNDSRKIYNLDLTKCRRIEQLSIEESSLSVSVSAAIKLRVCILNGINLSKGHVREALKNSDMLRHLDIRFCSLTDTAKEKFHLDLRATNSLEVLILIFNHFKIAASINAESLEKCSLRNYDLTEGNIIDALKTASSLLHLTIHPCSTGELFKERYHLDLTACKSLISLDINDINRLLTVDVTTLKHCRLVQFNLSLGNVFEKVAQSCPKLWHLELSGCYFSTSDDMKIDVFIDLSSYKYLYDIRLDGTPVRVKYINHIIGGKTPDWNRKKSMQSLKLSHLVGILDNIPLFERLLISLGIWRAGGLEGMT